MKQKIIFLKEVTDSNFDIDRLRLHEIENRGYSVEVWSLDELCFPGIKQKRRIVNEEYCLRYVETKREFLRLLSANRNAVFFDMLGEMKRQPNKQWIRLQLAKRKILFYLFFLNPVPHINQFNIKNREIISKEVEENDIIKKQAKIIVIFNNIRRLGLSKWIYFVIKGKIVDKWNNRIYTKYPPRGIFLSTRLSYGAIPEVYRKTPIVYTHSWDYEQYLDEKASISKYSEPIITFIDGAATHHPDFVYLGKQVYQGEDAVQKYYQDMCAFFDKIEKRFGFPVVIAAHPRSDYKGNEFGGRQIIKGKTHELIANAKLVLSTFSTAVSYIVIYEKPFMFIDNVLSKEISNDCKRAFEIIFKKERVLVEEHEQFILDNFIVNIETEKDEYMENYIIDSSVDKTKKFWDLVFENVEWD